MVNEPLSPIPPAQQEPVAPSQPHSEARFSPWVAVQTVLSVAVVMATLFTLWTPGNLFNPNFLDQIAVVNQPTEAPDVGAFPTQTPAMRARIGLVAGHLGNDSGAVCGPDRNNTREVDVNTRIATLVKQNLVNEGYNVDVFQEFDDALFQYQAIALISIHNDSCEYISDEATGYKVAAAPDSPYPEKAKRLTDCLTDRYGKTTGMTFHANTITPDMKEYHAFNEIHTTTPAAIIETGFLNLDYEKLTKETDQVAKGVTEGILCYIRNEPITIPTFEPAP